MTETVTKYKTATDAPDDDKALAKALAEIEAARQSAHDRIQEYIPHYRAALDVARLYPDVCRNTYLSPIEISWNPNSVPGVLLRCEDIVDLRAVLPLVRDLAAAGYTMHEMSDYAELRRRTWSFSVRGDKQKRTVISVMAFLPWGDEDTGAKCRVVEVPGTIKKIICGDEDT